MAPLVVGQVIRYLFPVRVKYLAAKFKFPILNSLALLCLVWSVFCDGVASDAFFKMTGVDIVAIIFVDIFMYLFGCAACLFVARLPWPTKYIKEPKWVAKWRFSRRDAVAIMVRIIVGFITCANPVLYIVLWCYKDGLNGYSFNQRTIL